MSSRVVRCRPIVASMALLAFVAPVAPVALTVTRAVAVEPGLPSRTSVLAATLRAIGAKHPDAALRNPDGLAIGFLGEQERALLTEFPADALDLDYQAAVDRLSDQDRGSVTTMVIRTKHFDAVFDEGLRAGARQVVILGAGLDSRGYRFRDRLRGIRFFEVDYGPTQEYKKARVRAALGGLPADLRYVPMDFTRDELLTQLKGGGYSVQERSVFIWEGVTMYLPEAAVTSTLRFVREHAAPGSVISFDYALASDSRINNPSTRFARFGEPWLSGFQGDSSAQGLRDAGLVSVLDRSMGELEGRYARRPDGTSSLPPMSDEQRARRLCVARVPERPAR